MPVHRPNTYRAGRPAFHIRVELNDRGTIWQPAARAQLAETARTPTAAGGSGASPMAVRVPNGWAWHPDWESCLKLHECAAQRPSLPGLTVPIVPHWHPDSFGTLRSRPPV